MARRAFYTSTEWLKCRKAYAASVFGLCERCKRPGLIVHHKIRITDENEDDPEVTLNTDNLELLCLDCHNAEHFRKEIMDESLRFDETGQLVKV